MFWNLSLSFYDQLFPFSSFNIYTPRYQAISGLPNWKQKEWNMFGRNFVAFPIDAIASESRTPILFFRAKDNHFHYNCKHCEKSDDNAKGLSREKRRSDYIVRLSFWNVAKGFVETRVKLECLIRSSVIIITLSFRYTCSRILREILRLNTVALYCIAVVKFHGRLIRTTLTSITMRRLRRFKSEVSSNRVINNGSKHPEWN